MIAEVKEQGVNHLVMPTRQPSSVCVVDFCFSDSAKGWSRLSVFVLLSNGSIYYFCPILPLNVLVSGQFFNSLYEHGLSLFLFL